MQSCHKSAKNGGSRTHGTYQCAERLVALEVVAPNLTPWDLDGFVVVSDSNVIPIKLRFFRRGQHGHGFPSNARRRVSTEKTTPPASFSCCAHRLSLKQLNGN